MKKIVHKKEVSDDQTEPKDRHSSNLVITDAPNNAEEEVTNSHSLILVVTPNETSTIIVKKDQSESRVGQSSTTEETCLPRSQAAVDACPITSGQEDSTGSNEQIESKQYSSEEKDATQCESTSQHSKTGNMELEVENLGGKVAHQENATRQDATPSEITSQQSKTDNAGFAVENHGCEVAYHENAKTQNATPCEITSQRSKTGSSELEVENHSSEVTNQGNSKTQRPVSKNYFKCSKCTPTRPFASSKALQKHQTRVHAQVLNHTCHNCGHCFKHPVDKIKSIRTVYTQTDVDGWMCEICCKTLSSFDEIEKHKLTSHSGNSKQSYHDRFACKFCAKTYQFQCQLRAHELVHTNTKAHKCPHCPKSFRLKGQLDTHVNIHTKQTVYSCGECGANFYQATVLHHHLRSKHQEWKYKCRFCQKGHVTKNDMLVHERIHTGEKPYVCEECGIGFSRKQNLNNHLKAHRNERSYACSECRKAFFRKSTLKEHLRTHTGEKPYQCQRCDKRFTQKSHLRAHLRSHLRQELERHQPLNQNEECNTQVVDGIIDVVPVVDIHPSGSNPDAVAETSVSGDGVGVVESVTDSGVVGSATGDAVAEIVTSDAELQNQNMQVAVSSDTISDECVVLVQDDTSSDTQAVEERDGNLVIQVELY